MEIDKILSRSFMKRLISLSGLGLVKGGAVSGAEIRRALRNNDKEVSLDNRDLTHRRLLGGRRLLEVIKLT